MTITINIQMFGMRKLKQENAELRAMRSAMAKSIVELNQELAVEMNKNQYRSGRILLLEQLIGRFKNAIGFLHPRRTANARVRQEENNTISLLMMDVNNLSL